MFEDKVEKDLNNISDRSSSEVAVRLCSIVVLQNFQKETCDTALFM